MNNAPGETTLMKQLEKQLFSPDAMDHALRDMVRDIASAYPPAEGGIALVGIHQLGVPLAERLRDGLAACGASETEFGKLDISMYRDDIGNRNPLPLIRETEIDFDVNDKIIILVDDVLSSGRTIRAALDALTDYGRPRMIRLAVLVDRGEPEYPIRADFIGFRVSLPPDRKVAVRFGDGNASGGIFEVEWKK